jgi:hypothetical protein
MLNFWNREEVMGKILFVLVFFNMLANICLADDKKKFALEAVQRAEEILGEFENTGAAFPAEYILQQLKMLKEKGVLYQKVLVGYADGGNDGNITRSGEFGSAGSSWRMGGSVGQTHMALSITAIESLKNGNRIIMLTLLFPDERELFGQQGTDKVKVSFSDFKGQDYVEVAVNFEERQLREDKKAADVMERVYRFDRKGVSPNSWKGVAFTMKRTGACFVIDDRLGDR